MIAKSLIAIFVILAVANAARLVSVGDNEEFRRTSFDSLFKLNNIKAEQSLTVSLQWGSNAPHETLNIYLYPAFGSPVSYGTPLSCEDYATSNTCTVTFDISYTQVAGDYWLWIQYDHSMSTEEPVIVSTLSVIGDSTTRSNPTILKQTFAAGQYRFHRVYSTTPKTLSVTVAATDNDQLDYYARDSFITVYSEDPENSGYLLYQYVPISNGGGKRLQSTSRVLQAVDSDLLTITYEYELTAGYYWIVVDLSSIEYFTDSQFEASNWRYRLSYSTEVYPCPYISDYPDYSGIFRGCEFASDNSKLPCIDYNDITGVCRACYPGYNLVNGRCVEADCPAGQYKKYGQCIENPTGCAIYSDFAKCTQCSIGYTLTNGVCNRTPLTCTGRNFFNSATWTCDKVNDKCREWGTDGLCTSCLSTTEKPVNGICVPIDSTCTPTQYVDTKGNCVENDLLCDSFEKYGGKCLKCIWGYQLDATKNQCTKIVCPTRYVPNDYGKCVKVSDLCVDFDARGNCLGCIPSHTLTSTGVCLQLESPSPCPPRQYLGDDNFCHDVSDFCEIYDRNSGMCSQCIGGYYLMYTGECVMQKNCKSRQVLINNDCHDVSPTCGNYDRATGKCLNCVSEAYELYYGLCIPVTTCGPRQWTDKDGSCHDVDAKCNTFNPSTGACTTCVQGYNYLNGICCVKGQFNLDGNCVVATSASSLSNSNGCRNFTNGIGCLRCDSGFQRLQDQYGFYYCQAL